jgi:hypothetical protein
MKKFSRRDALRFSALRALRDYWNRYIDNSQRPAALKFHGDPKENQVQ